MVAQSANTHPSTWKTESDNGKLAKTKSKIMQKNMNSNNIVKNTKKKKINNSIKQ